MDSKVLGSRYELIEKIGEGGMATVFKARCRILDRIVAVKILKEEFSKDKTFVEKFKTEALAAARITHPNIVNIYDVGQEEDIYYIVMEYIDGKTLKDYIRENNGPLTVNNAVDIAIMICDGVHHAHEKGVIHRDIKPQNILITKDQMVKVADFGIAKAISNATITFQDNMVGSVHYISPEQSRGEPVNRTTDIYSIGCVLYEMLTARVPFDADSPVTVALKHIHDEAPAPTSLNSEIPSGLEEIIFKAMEKLAAHRFASAEEMRNALLNIHTNVLSNYNPNIRNDKTIIRAPVKEGNEKNVRKKKMRPAGIAIIIIAIVGLFSGVIYMGETFFGEEVEVPNIVGIKTADADKKLDDHGLIMNVIENQYNEEVAEDLIISQDPVEGFKVKEGREVKVIISKGTELFKVPNLRGKSLREAEITLTNTGLELGETEKIYDNKYSEGLIISQDPGPGIRAKSGEKVVLIISKGKEPSRVKMPRLIGLSVEEARKKLQEKNLIIGEQTRDESEVYYEGKVISQKTETGVLVEEGSSVGIVISKGPGPIAKTKALEFHLPGDEEFYHVVINIRDASPEHEGYNVMHHAEDKVVVAVTYMGSGTAIVLLNGVEFKTFKLE